MFSAETIEKQKAHSLSVPGCVELLISLSLPPSVSPSYSGLRAEAVCYPWLDRAELCTAQQSGVSGQRAAAQVAPPHVTQVLRLQVKRGAQGHVPGVARESTHAQARQLLAHTHAHTRTLSITLLGHQRSSHRVILPRRESKDILDSGSKSQRANKEQREICCPPTSGVQETNPSCVLFGGNCWILH